VPSRILYTIFHELHPSVYYTPHGVDPVTFSPRTGGVFSSPAGELVLGWAGSLANHPGKRGVEDFILPALKGLKGVALKLAAREEKWRTQEEMAEFYQGLDALICASRTEGGPHPLLEASACQIPVISTRVGLAPDLIEHGRNGLLVDRTVEAIRDAVIRLRDDQELRLKMGRSAREIVEARWNWDVQARHYIPFFEHGLKDLPVGQEMR
jgi:glycosyltransferase involved in cell wall biosynthesis